MCAPPNCATWMIFSIRAVNFEYSKRILLLNVLFVCSRNRIRSVTAQRMYAGHAHIMVRSAGTASSARHRISADDVLWADLIFAFEARHKQQIQQQFGALLQTRRVLVLDIPDEYQLMDEELVAEIAAQVQSLLP
jgi:predicted protein tyrosine phosphatase